MIWAMCSCGWVGATEEGDAFEMHPLSEKCRIRTRLFNQPHMASEGVERLLAEARWGKA